MPCYTERRVTVELKVADKALLRQALATMGVRVVESGEVWMLYRENRALGRFVGGQVELGYGVNATFVNDIKQAYSVQAVKQAARRFNWTVLSQKENEFLIQRRF